MDRTRQSLATPLRATVLALCLLLTAGCTSLPWFEPKEQPMPPPPMTLPQAMADTSVEPPMLSQPATEGASRGRMRVAMRRPPPAPKPPMEAPPQPPPPPAVSPEELVGSDYAAILKVLRRPDRVDNSALSVVWSYSDMDCRLQLFFYPDIETTKFHLVRFDLKNAAGEKLANSDSCMQQFMARNDGAFSQ